MVSATHRFRDGRTPDRGLRPVRYPVARAKGYARLAYVLRRDPRRIRHCEDCEGAKAAATTIFDFFVYHGLDDHSE